MPIEGQSGRVATDCADEAKPLGEDLSDKASSSAKVQGGAYGDGRGSSDSTTNDASNEPRQLVLKALTEDGGRQC